MLVILVVESSSKKWYSSLFPELESAEKPAMKTEVVKFAGVDVQVTVKDTKKPSARPSNIEGILDQLKG